MSKAQKFSVEDAIRSGEAGIAATDSFVKKVRNFVGNIYQGMRGEENQKVRSDQKFVDQHINQEKKRRNRV